MEKNTPGILHTRMTMHGSERVNILTKRNVPSKIGKKQSFPFLTNDSVGPPTHMTVIA